ncbi:MAG: hypothetical protein ACRDZ2_12740, partial [Ilumatobacteraceae bacterium]
VLTLTRRPGIGQVQFSLEGEPLAVPGGDGVQTDPGESVSRVDYADLLSDPGPDDSQPEETTPDVSDPTTLVEPMTAPDPTTPST